MRGDRDHQAEMLLVRQCGEQLAGVLRGEVRSHGNDDDVVRLGRQDRSACGEGIRRGTSGSRGDQAVSDVTDQFAPVHGGGQSYGAKHLPPPHDNLVQCIPLTHRVTRPDMFGAQHHTILDPCFAIQEFVKILTPFIPVNLNEKPHSSQVHTQDRDVAGSTQMSRPQNASVAARDNQDIKLTPPDSLSQILIIQGTKRGVDPPFFQVSRHCFHFHRGSGHSGIGSDNGSLWYECIGHDE